MNYAPLTIQLRPVDYLLAERHVAESLRRQGRWYWPIRSVELLASLLLALGFIGLFAYEPRSSAFVSVGQVRNSAFMLLVAVALLCVVVYLQRRSVAGVLFAPGSKLLQPYTLAIVSDGIEVKSASGTASLPWVALLQVELHTNHLFIFTQPNYAIVIPAHAFSSRVELATFAKMLTQAKLKHAAT